MQISAWKDKALFTPGPLTTSRTVKQAMLRDLGSRDPEFTAIVAEIRQRLLLLASADSSQYTAVLMQGSGTFAVEATLGSVVPLGGQLALLVNGAYGERMVQIADMLGIDTVVLRSPENSPIDPGQLEKLLAHEQELTHVAVVHCETTTGLINPIREIAALAERHAVSLIVDAMSSFGGYPIDLNETPIHFLISSANKCIEGVPGFAFVLAHTATLLATRGWARSVSLDLLAQYEALEKDGQFRFTPPVQSLLAFHQALAELAEEGGVAGRAARYARNCQMTVEGMRALGLQPYIEAEADRSHIITAFRYPEHPGFEFSRFYQLLSEYGQIIYPGKLSHANCFRIGHIGRLDTSDVTNLLWAVRAALTAMGLPLQAYKGGS